MHSHKEDRRQLRFFTVISHQILISFYALLLGAALGVVYDAFRVLRLVGFSAFVLVFLEDILFFAICTVSLFSFYMQFLDGKFRIYVFPVY